MISLVVYLVSNSLPVLLHSLGWTSTFLDVLRHPRPHLHFHPHCHRPQTPHCDHPQTITICQGQSQFILSTITMQFINVIKFKISICICNLSSSYLYKAVGPNLATNANSNQRIGRPRFLSYIKISKHVIQDWYKCMI